MILNVETFDGSNPAVNKVKLDGLLSVLRRSGESGFRVLGKDIPLVDGILRCCLGQQARCIERKLLRKCVGGSLAAVENYRVCPKGCTQSLSARYMALASADATISIGLSDTAYKDDFTYSLLPDSIDSCMLTCNAHLQLDDYRRWRFLKAFEDKLDYEKYVTIASSQQGKHFSPSLQRLPISPDSRWEQTWIDSTRGGPGHAALFMPGLISGSVEHYYLIYLALRAAYKAGRYALKGLKGGFVVNLRTPIGAAGGKKVCRIKLYCSEGNAIHIRPFECETEDDYALPRPYVPNKHEYDMM